MPAEWLTLFAARPGPDVKGATSMATALPASSLCVERGGYRKQRQNEYFSEN
jgi:putative hemolysin